MYKRSLTLLLFAVLQTIGSEAAAQCVAPPAPGAADATICSGTTAALTATGTGTIGWYDAASGGNWLGGGASFTTPVLSGTTIYYAQDSTCAASTTRKAVTVTVNASPAAGFSFTTPVCTGAVAKFNAASGCGSNNAINFQGNASASRPTICNLTNNITMEIWARWSGGNVGSNQILFYNGHTGNGGYGILIDPSGNLKILVGGLAYLSSPVALTPGYWQHVAIVRNSGTWSLYLDGIQYSVSPNTTNPNSPSATSGNQVSIGWAQDGGQRYYGDLDEAKFWTVVRSTAEIQADMKSCTTGAVAGLLAYWGFSEGTGTTVADGTGNGYSLSLTGTSWTTTGAPTGAVTYAWDFGDGTNSTARNNQVTYASSGTKTVSYTVTDANNCTATSSSAVTVNQSPTASISGTSTNCDLVTLTASGPGTYSWSGGNSPGTAVNTFSSSGSYTVTVTNPAGCIATAVQGVTVNALPAVPASGPLPLVTSFTNVNSGRGLAFDSSGNLYVAEGFGSRIRKITPGGSVSIFRTSLPSPQALFIDKTDTIYLSSNSDVKKIAPDASLVATYSPFSSAYGIQVASGSKKIYVAERSTGLIRVIDGGAISTFASGLSSPAGIAFDSTGNLFVAEQTVPGNIRKIQPDGTISTFATGLNAPYGIAFDAAGNLFVAESNGTRNIVKIAPDGTSTIYVTLNNNPQYLALDKNGNLFVTNGSTVTKIVPPVANVTTVTDSGYVTLIATPASGITVDWYSQSSGGAALLAGNTSYITPVVNATTNYYAEARNATTGCISSGRTIVAVTVNFNKVSRNGKISIDDTIKVNKNGASGVSGVTKNGKVVN